MRLNDTVKPRFGTGQKSDQYSQAKKATKTSPLQQVAAGTGQAILPKSLAHLKEQIFFDSKGEIYFTTELDKAKSHVDLSLYRDAENLALKDSSEEQKIHRKTLQTLNLCTGFEYIGISGENVAKSKSFRDPAYKSKFLEISNRAQILERNAIKFPSAEYNTLATQLIEKAIQHAKSVLNGAVNLLLGGTKEKQSYSELLVTFGKNLPSWLFIKLTIKEIVWPGTFNKFLWGSVEPLSLKMSEVSKGPEYMGLFSYNFDAIGNIVKALDADSKKQEFCNYKPKPGDEKMADAEKARNFTTYWSDLKVIVPPTHVGLNIDETLKFYSDIKTYGGSLKIGDEKMSQLTAMNAIFFNLCGLKSGGKYDFSSDNMAAYYRLIFGNDSLITMAQNEKFSEKKEATIRLLMKDCDYKEVGKTAYNGKAMFALRDLFNSGWHKENREIDLLYSAYWKTETAKKTLTLGMVEKTTEAKAKIDIIFVPIEQSEKIDLGKINRDVRNLFFDPDDLSKKRKTKLAELDRALSQLVMTSVIPMNTALNIKINKVHKNSPYQGLKLRLILSKISNHDYRDVVMDRFIAQRQLRISAVNLGYDSLKHLEESILKDQNLHQIEPDDENEEILLD